MICGTDSSKVLGNRRECLSANRFYYELPTHRSYLYLPESFLVMSYCISLYAHVLLFHIHTCCQTLPMLFQSAHRKIVQPFHTSIKDSRVESISLTKGMSIYMLSGRIGAWLGDLNACSRCPQSQVGLSLHGTSSSGWKR